MGEFARRALVASAIFLGLAILLVVALALRTVLAVVLIALALAAAIRPLALTIQRDLRVGFALATLLTCFGLLLVGAAILTLVVPLFLNDLLAFAAAAPGYAAPIAGYASDLSRLVGDGGPPAGRGPDIGTLAGVGLSALAGLLAVPIGFASVVVWSVTTLALAFYWLLERDAVLWRIGTLVPPARRRRVDEVWIAVERKLGAYVLGQLAVSATIGALTLIGLSALGVRYALVLAIFASVTEMIPIIGPLLAAIPAVVVALFQAPWLGLATIALYLVIQQVEGYLIYPQIQKRVSKISAFWLLLALIVGAELMGILGAVIAVPVAVTIGAVLEELAPPTPTPATGPTAAAGAAARAAEPGGAGTAGEDPSGGER